VNPSVPGRADALAAQYVLGTLRGRARARFERMSRSHPAVAEAIRQWEERLVPFAEQLPAVQPPPRVWRAILKRIRGSEGSAGSSLWANLGLWRGLALAGLAAAFVLAVALFTPAPERPQGTLVAVLSGSDAKAALIASADRFGRYLTVKAISRIDVPADRSLELWMLPGTGNPRSLGTFDANVAARVALSGEADQALSNIPVLAVSLEPRGGSPTGQPTGPVLYTGPVQRLY
jgi:anti-sigma-K factor RskA